MRKRYYTTFRRRFKSRCGIVYASSYTQPASHHDRCVIPIKPENVDAWLRAGPNDLAAMYAILDDRERPFYEHRLAA